MQRRSILPRSVGAQADAEQPSLNHSMKKTLITLAALFAGSASALAEGTLVWDLTVTGDTYKVTNGEGGDYTSLNVNLNNATISNGVCTTPGTGNRVYITDSAPSLAMNTSFSFVIQGGLAEAPSNWGVLFGFGEDNNWNLKVNVDTSNGGSLGIAPEGYAPTDMTRGGSITPGDGTFIVTYDVTADNTAAIKLYQNGILIATATQASANVTGEKLDVFSLGGRPYEADDGSVNNLTSFSFDNVQLYEGVLSADQIASLSGVTPEPTTATLSLLALAGLCARRRRK